MASSDSRRYLLGSGSCRHRHSDLNYSAAGALDLVDFESFVATQSADLNEFDARR